MKDKSIKSTMKSWIMLSEKELDDTQVYMQEQEQQDQQEKDNSFSEAESGSGNVGSAKYESQVSDAGTETFSDEENDFERKLSREEQVDQLIKEAGEEVVDPEVDSVPRKRRKRHQNKKGKFEKGEARESIESEERFVSESADESMSDTTREKESMASEVENAAELTKDNGNKSDKSSGISKMLVGGVGVLLVLIIAGLGYQTQSLQKQNQKLKTEISTLKKEKKQAEQASEEQTLQTKNEDGVVENTDKMFASVGVGDKEYKLLAKVSDFTKDGWKLEALRNENATLVPGGKLEKDAFLTNKDGRKIGVIIRNLSDKNQKVSDCIVTKLSFSKEMFDGQITLPGSLGFDSTEKELKAAGFKKDAEELKKLNTPVITKNLKQLYRLLDIKAQKKAALADYLEKTQGITINPDSIFDIQIKRLHEYKRQQMNALYLIHKYLESKRVKNQLHRSLPSSGQRLHLPISLPRILSI